LGFLFYFFLDFTFLYIMYPKRQISVTSDIK
jgi:hypothetical protein